MNNGNSFNLDMVKAAASGDSIVFPFDVEKALDISDFITVSGVTVSGAVYDCVPAWYNVTDKLLYSAVTGTDYWEVEGNTLTYTEDE